MLEKGKGLVVMGAGLLVLVVVGGYMYIFCLCMDGLSCLLYE